MTALELLVKLHGVGIRVWVERGELKFSAPKGTLTPTLREALVAHKPEIIGLLSEAQAAEPIPVVSRDVALPLSFPQSQLWFIEQIDPGGSLYTIAGALRLRGALDGTAFERALAALVARHESLRTRFVAVDGAPRQIIDPQVSVGLMRESLETRDDAETWLMQRLRDEARTGFDLAHGPVFRVHLFRLAADDHALSFAMHHIVSDGWSLGILVRDLAALYAAECSGTAAALPTLGVHYADFAVWQRERLQCAQLDSRLAYWKTQLAGAPPLLAMPTDRPRPPAQTHAGAVYHFMLPPALLAGAKALAQANGVTLFMVGLAAYQLLLSRYSHQNDIVVGVPLAGRDRRETEDLIGHFINVVAMRTILANNPSVADLIERVRETTLGAYAHQDLPFEMVVDAVAPKRRLDHPPIAQVGFALQNTPLDLTAFGTLAASTIDIDPGMAKYDFIWNLAEAAPGLGGAEAAPGLDGAETTPSLHGFVEYNTDLFDEATIARLARHYARVLEAMVADPGQPIEAIDLADADELRVLLELDADIERVLPLTRTQQALYLDALLHPDTSSNCLGIAYEVQGAFDPERWHSAIDAATADEPMLRTQLAPCEAAYADVAYQVVQRDYRMPVALIDLATAPHTPDTLWARVTSMIYRPYGVQEAAVRHIMIRLSATHNIVIVAGNHILHDGVSMTAHFVDCWARYSALGHAPANAAPPGPLRPDLFAAFVAFERHEFDRTETLAFWRERLRETEPLDFPASGATGAHVARKLAVEAAHLDAIRAYCRRQRITPALYLKGLFALVLAQYCRPAAPFVIEEVVAGRPADQAQTLGCYYQRLPFIVMPHWLRGSVEALFTAGREAHKAAKDFGLLSPRRARELTPRGRLTAVFNFYNFSTAIDVDGHTGHFRQYSPLVGEGEVQFIPKLADGQLSLHLYYHEGDFRDFDFLPRVRALSEQIVGGTRELAALSYVTAGERARLFDWGRAPRAFTFEGVPAQFERRVEQMPEATAVICGDARLSYAQLNARANQLAQYLISQGVQVGERVGICLERSLDLIVAVLATLKARAAYVPLDPAYPPERINLMLDDAGARFVLSHTQQVTQLAAHTGVTLCLDTLDLVEVASENPHLPAQADDLFYVIYTSGSTGRPKGAAVYHAGAANLLAWYGREFAIVPEDRVLLMASFGFDLAQKNLFVPLLNGAALVIPPFDHFDIERLLDVIERDRVTWLNAAPSPFYLLVATPARLRTLKHVFLGGEPIQMRRLADWLHSTECHADVVNTYGPTECTDIAAFYRATDPTPWLDEPMPLGRPNDNVALYVVNADNQLLPPGLVGELCIAGQGVGAGYLNNDALNAEKFLPDPFAEGRLYRTGDLAFYRDDGLLVYVGRADFQIKLRGLRIELGEIEFAVRAEPGVTDCLVRVCEERLVAYLVGAAAAIDLDTLRARLHSALPEHMVPQHFVVLTQFPLTPNGKIDHRALPAPQADTTQGYVAPRTEGEAILAGIWEQLLGSERIGIHDNFFEHGGDSILSIQMIARAREHGLALRPRQIFEHQTIAELAPVAGHAQQQETGPAIGNVPLLPLQRWLFSAQLPQPAHWNQSVLLSVQSPLAVAVLESVFARLVSHHDALRLRYRSEGAALKQAYAASETHAFLRILDLSDEPAATQAHRMLEATEAAQASLGLAEGPLLRAVYFTGIAPARLFIVIHHLAVDAVSWRILLEDMQTLCHDARAVLPVRTSAFKHYAEWLEAQAVADTFEPERAYWQAQAGDAAVAADMSMGDDDVASQREVRVILSVEETRALLTQALTRYRTQINDFLLAALAQGWRECGRGDLYVHLEGHGRDGLPDELDLSRTVGWFTVMYPVRLALGTADAPATILKQVKETLRAVPNRGRGYGVLRYLACECLDFEPPRVSFNYLGQLDMHARGEALFAPVLGPQGHDHDPRTLRPHAFDVSALVRGGRLEIAVGYSKNRHHASSVEALAAQMHSALRTLIAHCMAPGEGGFTPSDFPLARLDQARLDRVVAAQSVHGAIADLYPCTPMQEGMLFQTLLAPKSGVYVERLVTRLEGPLDPVAFRAAWEGVFAQHSVLRTAFASDGLERPLQVVYERVPLDLKTHDWRGETPEVQEEKLATLLDTYYGEGFDLARPPLMRIALVRTAEAASWCVWVHHHIQMDGWSLPIVMMEFLARYEAARSGVQAMLPRTRPYRDYIAWLMKQDGVRAAAFWRERLAGFTSPTPLGLDRPPLGPDGSRRKLVSRYEERRQSLSTETSAGLEQLAKTHQLTLNTLLQGAWALLLGRYSGNTDVVFGATVSGRSGGLDDVVTMVGLFINTLPVRVELPATRDLLDWLKDIQAGNSAAAEYEWTPLIDIHGASAVPRTSPLFESIFVFENYPVDSALKSQEGSLRFSDLRAFEQTNYPMTLVAGPGERVNVRALFDLARFEPEAVERLLNHFVTLLESMLAHPRATLSELSILPTPEREQVLHGFNATSVTESGIDLATRVEQQVARTPDAAAVVFEQQTLSYRELNQRANRLAHYLIAQGVGPDRMVAIAIERSLEMAIAVLGVIKAGGAYVPIDPNYPPERVALMLEDTGAPVLLTSAALAERFVQAHGSTHILRLDADWANVNTQSDTDPPVTADAQNLGYVIFTSGSTGRPKGVAMTRRPLMNLVAWQLAQFGDLPPLKTLQFASLSFDVSFQELFSTWASGGTLMMIPEEYRFDPGSLLALIREAGVGRLFLPFIVLQHLCEMANRGEVHFPALREVITAGEQLQITREIAAFFEANPHCVLHNHYGPSETHVVTALTLQGAAHTWPALPTIGRPIDNVRMYVLDDAGAPVPIGVAGELYIGGIALARGYLNRPELTEERFVADPFDSAAGARLYRTGDLARWRTDGTLEYLGRIDFQVKIRGFRVELGEIEACLALHPQVQDVAVSAREDTPGNRILVAYVVPSLQPPAAGELKQFVKAALPDYMVPGAIVLLEQLPLSPNGKVDRKALPAPDPAMLLSTREYVAPRTPTEEAIAEIWCELLRIERVGALDHFFELGGHSLLATRVVSQVRDAFAIEIPVKVLFEHPTLAEFTEAIENAILEDVAGLSDEEAAAQLDALQADPIHTRAE